MGKIEIKQGHFNKISELPFGYPIYTDKTSDEYLLLQVNEAMGLTFLWNSRTNVKPKIKDYPELDVLIVSTTGFIFIISMSTGLLIMKMPLHEDLEEIIITTYGILLLTETMVLKLDNKSFAVNFFTPLPDVIDKYQINNDEIAITGITGDTFNVKF